MIDQKLKRSLRANPATKHMRFNHLQGPLVCAPKHEMGRSAPRPKTTCLPSSQLVTTVVRKNCEPLVSFPLFAIDSMPGLSCFSAKVSSCMQAAAGR